MPPTDAACMCQRYSGSASRAKSGHLGTEPENVGFRKRISSLSLSGRPKILTCLTTIGTRTSARSSCAVPADSPAPFSCEGKPLAENGCSRAISPPVSRFGATRLAHLYQALQAFFSRDFNCVRCNPVSSFPGFREYKSFKRSVIEFACWLARNFAIALAYSSLLESRRRRAVASAQWKRSSGSETAVFILIV